MTENNQGNAEKKSNEKGGVLPPIERYYSPGWCGSLGWASSPRMKIYQFNSRSGHVPGLQARSPNGDM